MNNLTSVINVQVNKSDKDEATKILQKLGISMSSLINMTLKQVIMREGIPFEVSIPKENSDLYKYFTKEELNNSAKELNYMENHLNEYKSYNNIEDLKKDLLTDD